VCTFPSPPFSQPQTERPASGSGKAQSGSWVYGPGKSAVTARETGAQSRDPSAIRRNTPTIQTRNLTRKEEPFLEVPELHSIPDPLFILSVHQPQTCPGLRVLAQALAEARDFPRQS
jgi:hypothetical protein